MISESLATELRQVEASALSLSEEFDSFAGALSELKAKAETLRRCHSNSVFGDHALTYYEDFEPPTRGFDVEWGLLSGFNGAHNPGWITYPLEELLQFVYGGASYDEIDNSSSAFDVRASEVRDRSLDLLSLVEEHATGTVKKISEEISGKIQSAFEGASATEYVRRILNGSPKMTRDSRNMSQGLRTPVHVAALAQLHFVSETAEALRFTANAMRRLLIAAELARPELRARHTGTAVFIGHGRSPVWRELQAYLEKELGLKTEEFNSESVAGVSTQTRLNEMLKSSAMAFLVMTGEDVGADGSQRARENVIHETGLFQGSLGWTRAIVLLEAGCSEFSNLHGINHIQFEKGAIKGAFVDVRRALAREGLVTK